mmetsp:Transcript_22652/g.49275  ORF Transcript_22652/g.49275 Transcript_22652/m.49275 type:complete len:108 (-) Transcript_22652:222-545(-)
MMKVEACLAEEQVTFIFLARKDTDVVLSILTAICASSSVDGAAVNPAQGMWKIRWQGPSQSSKSAKSLTPTKPHSASLHSATRRSKTLHLCSGHYVRMLVSVTVDDA